MARFSGRRVNIGIGLEASGNRGVHVAPVYWYPFLEANIADSDSPLFNDSAYGSIIKNNAKTTSLIAGGGTLSGKIYAKGIYYFLALVFGQLPTLSSVAGDAAAKKYTFSLLESNEHLSATLATKTPNEDLRFPFAMPESFTLNWAPDQYPTIEIPLTSAKSVATANTYVALLDTEFLPKQAALRIAANIAGLDAASVLTDIKSFSLTFTKTLSPQQTMDSGDTYGGIFNTDFEITGKIEKLANNTTYKGYALQDAVRAMRFSLIDPVNLAGATTPTSLTFDFSNVTFDSHAPSYGRSDISTESLNFAGMLSVGNFSETVSATLINKYTYA